MAGRKTLALTERQFAVLRILWAEGPLTVRELAAHIPRGDRLPYTTVLGLVQNMEKAGLVGHTKEGLTHRYAAAVAERETTRTVVRDFLNRFFRGSAEALVAGLVDADALSPEDLGELKAKLAAARETPDEVRKPAESRKPRPKKR